VLSVFLGKGDGTFQNQFQFPTGSAPIWAAVADVNGDGNQDIVVANQQGNSVSVLLGTGNGGFQAQVQYPTAAFPTAVAIADLNGDGVPDVAVSAGNSNTVSVLWGNGDGTFQGPENYGTGDIPYSVIAADFNQDGVIDLAVANSGGNSVSIILNSGKQAFQTRLDYPAGPEPYSVVAADFNGDGIFDLAVTNSNCSAFPNCNAGTVSIMFGNGDGTFQSPVPYSTGTDTDPYSLAVGDFNGDKIPDLVVTNYATNTVSLFLGSGDGIFQGHVDFPTGREPDAVAVGDFNGDHNFDLVVANFHDNTVSVLLGTGTGTFQSAVTYSVGHGPVDVAVGDFNGDKKLDLVVINETDNNASVLLGNGDGTFQAQVAYPIVAGGNPLSVVVGDFNGDGTPDLAVADYQSQQVSILLGKGDGSFQTAKEYPTGANPSSVVLGDFNGDGKLDVALASTPLGSSPGNLVSVLLGNGDGTFQAPSVYGTGSQAYSAAVGDFNGDGAVDIAVANGISNTVSILLNTQGNQITLNASTNPSTYGGSVTFTTTVKASMTGAPTPTGTVTLWNGSSKLGSSPLNASGVATLALTTLPVGSNTILAAYSGDSNFQANASHAMKQTVQTANTNLALASSSSSANLTLTATISSQSSTMPTGPVSFVDGATALGTSSLNSSGIATFSTSALAAGPHSITASYGGNSNFNSSTSSVLPVTAGFTLAAAALSPASVAPGGSSTSSVTVTPVNGFNLSGVTFTCAVSPAATPAPVCTVGSVSISNGTGTASVTVSTTGSERAAADHRRSLLNAKSSTSTLLAFAMLIPGILFITGGAGKEHRRRLFAYFLGALVLGGCMLQVACGGGSSGSSTTTPPPASGTPAGTYTVTVTGSSNGVQSAAPALTLTVQ